jgi:hypothetical protein
LEQAIKAVDLEEVQARLETLKASNKNHQGREAMKETTLKRLERIEAEPAAADDADTPYFRIEFYDIDPDGTLKRQPNPDGTTIHTMISQLGG